MALHYSSAKYDPEKIKGDLDGLYGRMPGDLQKLVRRIADAPNYDLAAMELLDVLKLEWREQHPARHYGCWYWHAG